jgi:hypothetical protein
MGTNPGTFSLCLILQYGLVRILNRIPILLSEFISGRGSPSAGSPFREHAGSNSQGVKSTVNKDGLVTESITPQVTGSHRSYRSHTDYDFELVDKSVLEIPMGLNKDWSIKRIGENGDTWLCDCPGCSDNNGGNVITGSVGAINGHALDHENIEIQEELERLNDLNLGSLLEELRKCSRGTLQMFQNRVEHGSTLERFVLEALDEIEESKPSTK